MYTARIRKDMAHKYIRSLIFSMLFAAVLCGSNAYAETRRPPADNDDTYKLPMYVPKAALPKTTSQKVIFQDENSDNDELYVMPKQQQGQSRTAATSSSLAAAGVSNSAPASGVDPEAQAQYQRQYEEYQRQMKVYNEQMAQYQKQLEAQRQAQQQTQNAPIDNDSAYVLPGQYSPVKNRPAAPQPKQAVQQPAQQAPQQQYQQPQYQQPQPAAQKPISAQYHQQYNYFDDSNTSQKKDSGGGSAAFPNYYY